MSRCKSCSRTNLLNIQQHTNKKQQSRYSGFKDTHGNTKNEMAEGAASHHLEEELKARGVTDVFCVGTAGDFCVAHTAIHAAQAGFKTYVLSDVVRNIDPSGEEFEHQVKEMKKAWVVVTTFKT